MTEPTRRRAVAIWCVATQALWVAIALSMHWFLGIGLPATVCVLTVLSVLEVAFVSTRRR